MFCISSPVSILAPSVSAWLSIRSIKSGWYFFETDSSLFFCYECIPSIFVFSIILSNAISLGVSSGKTSCSTTYYEYIIYFSVGYFIDIGNLVSVALSGLGFHWIKWLGWFFPLLAFITNSLAPSVVSTSMNSKLIWLSCKSVCNQSHQSLHHKLALLVKT
jgi:hypothetical protein